MLKLIYTALIGFFLAFALTQTQVMAQEKEKVVIKEFTLKDAQAKEVSLNAFAKHKAVVVVFTSSHCSWATKYEERLTKLYEQFSEKEVGFLAINSNDASINQNDAVARMRQLSPFSFPYLKDEEQLVARMFGATRTPEVFVLVPQDSVFSVAYHGKIDDNPLDEASVKEAFLADALNALLSGSALETLETEASGCNIKWLREEEMDR